MPYMIQERFVLRRLAAGVVTETPYFSPDPDTIEVLNGAPGGTICIAESSRSGFEAGAPVRAIILLDPWAWRFRTGETQHAFDRHQIACGIVRKVDSSS